MKRRVILAATAERDLARLVTFLASVAPQAAVNAADTIRDAVISLEDMPERGRRISGAGRQLIVPFGDSGYVIQYRVGANEVLVGRIFHMRENRPS